MKKLLFYIFILTLTLLTSSCKRTEPALRVGISIWPGYAPAYLSKAKQYFSKEDIKVIEYISATEVMRAMTNGAIDLAGLTLDEALKLSASGLELDILLVANISNGGDAIIARKNIKNFSDLKGKNIALEYNAVGEYFLHLAAKHKKISLKEFKLIDLSTYEHESVMNNNEIDAIVTYEPIVSNLSNSFNVIFSSKEIPNTIMDVIVAKKGLDKNKIKIFTEAWFKSVNNIHSKDIQTFDIMYEYLSLHDKSKIQSSLKGIEILNKNKSDELLNSANTLLYKNSLSIINFFLEKEKITQKQKINIFNNLHPLNEMKKNYEIKN